MELDYKTGSAPASRQLRARASMSYPKMLLHFIQVALFSPIALYQAVQQCATICDCEARNSAIVCSFFHTTWRCTSVVDQIGFTRNICSRIPTFAMAPPGAMVTFILQGGRVSCGVAERTLSFIKALDSAWKTLEPCDRELLHHTQLMPMLFRWLRRHK